MKIHDISQEVFGCQVYPGDPAPEKQILNSMEEGDSYNLSAFSMCAHNGTHIDAPFHFIRDGKTVDSIDLDAFVGMAYVAEHQGTVSGDDAAEIIKKRKNRIPKQQRGYSSREKRKFLRKRQKSLHPQGCYCLATNPRLSVLKTHRWKCISYCWVPVLYCLKESG